MTGHNPDPQTWSIAPVAGGKWELHDPDNVTIRTLNTRRAAWDSLRHERFMAQAAEGDAGAARELIIWGWYPGNPDSEFEVDRIIRMARAYRGVDE